jgi:hypothetical protein
MLLAAADDQMNRREFTTNRRVVFAVNVHLDLTTVALDPMAMSYWMEVM